MSESAQNLIVPMADLVAQHHALLDELREAFDGVMEKCQFILGPNVAELEQETAQLCGAHRGLGVGSGTDALLLSLIALGVGPGDEVITTPFTFVATAEVVLLAGAKPVFADIDPATFNLDPKSVEKAITSNTKAIIPVHLFGQMADMESLNALAVSRGIRIVGDAAQAIGATYQGRPIGAWSDLTTLSFFPTKNLGGCGDGGMILTDSDELAEKIRLLRFHGSGGGYFYKEVGYCSRLDEIQAALLRVKAKRLTQWNQARLANAERYNAAFASLAGDLITPVTAEGNEHIFHQYTLRVPAGRRDELQRFLASRHVSSAIYYPLALHLQDAYRSLGYSEGDLPESEKATQEVLSLPIHPDLKPEQIEYVIEAVKAFFA